MSSASAEDRHFSSLPFVILENKRPAQRKDRPFCGQEGPRPAGDRPTVSGRAGLAFQSHPTEGSCKQKATCYPMPSEGQHPTRTRCVGLSAQSQAHLCASLASNGSMGSRPMASMLHFAHELQTSCIYPSKPSASESAPGWKANDYKNVGRRWPPTRQGQRAFSSKWLERTPLAAT